MSSEAPETYPVRGPDWTGNLLVWRGSDGKASQLRVVLPDGREFPVSRDQVDTGVDAFTVNEPLGRLTEEHAVIPIISEQLVIGREAVPTGKVQVRKHVDEHTEHVEMPLTREDVDIRRVVVDKVVEAVPPVREEGDVTVIPVVEEQLVVTKRLVLREEVHLRRVRTTTRAVDDVTLRKERAEVVRTDPEGRVGTPARETPHQEGRHTATAQRRNRILKDW